MITFNGLVLDVPTFVLVFLLVLGGAVLWSAQRRDDFDFAPMLCDETGKASALRLAIFICIAVSSWVVIKVTMNTTDPDKAFNYFVVYTAVWSGAKIVEKLLDVLILKFGGKP